MTSLLSKFAIGLGILLALYAVRLVYLARTTPAASDFATTGPLEPCPTARPNCVCSLNREEGFAIAPISLAGIRVSEAGDLGAKLTAAINAQPGAAIKFTSKNRIDASFRSKLIGFIDDATFVIDEQQALIHFKSRSRVGYSDLGVNRKRMEAIRAAFAAN